MSHSYNRQFNRLDRSRYRSRSQERDEYRRRSQEKIASTDRYVGSRNMRYKEHYNSRSQSRDRPIKYRSISRDRLRSRSKDKYKNRKSDMNRNNNRGVNRSNSRDRNRAVEERNRRSSRDRSRAVEERNRHSSRDRSRDYNRSRNREYYRSKSRDRSRDYDRSRNREYSRSKSRDRSREYNRSRSRSKDNYRRSRRNSRSNSNNNSRSRWNNRSPSTNRSISDGDSRDGSINREMITHINKSNIVERSSINSDRYRSSSKENYLRESNNRNDSKVGYRMIDDTRTTRNLSTDQDRGMDLHVKDYENELHHQDDMGPGNNRKRTEMGNKPTTSGRRTEMGNIVPTTSGRFNNDNWSPLTTVPIVSKSLVTISKSSSLVDVNYASSDSRDYQNSDHGQPNKRLKQEIECSNPPTTNTTKQTLNNTGLTSVHNNMPTPKQVINILKLINQNQSINPKEENEEHPPTFVPKLAAKEDLTQVNTSKHVIKYKDLTQVDPSPKHINKYEDLTPMDTSSHINKYEKHLDESTRSKNLKSRNRHNSTSSSASSSSSSASSSSSSSSSASASSSSSSKSKSTKKKKKMKKHIITEDKELFKQKSFLLLKLQNMLEQKKQMHKDIKELISNLNNDDSGTISTTLIENSNSLLDLEKQILSLYDKLQVVNSELQVKPSSPKGCTMTDHVRKVSEVSTIDVKSSTNDLKQNKLRTTPDSQIQKIKNDCSDFKELKTKQFPTRQNSTTLINEDLKIKDKKIDLQYQHNVISHWASEDDDDDGGVGEYHKSGKMGLMPTNQKDNNTTILDSLAPYIKYVDGGIHWCNLCDMFSDTLPDYIEHLLCSKHASKLKSDSKCWLKKNKKTKKLPNTSEDSQMLTIPYQGVEFLHSAMVFYCAVCDVFLKCKSEASQHPMTEIHLIKYVEYQKQNPSYESTYNKSRMIALARFSAQEIMKSSQAKTSNEQSIDLTNYIKTDRKLSIPDTKNKCENEEEYHKGHEDHKGNEDDDEMLSDDKIESKTNFLQDKHDVRKRKEEKQFIKENQSITKILSLSSATMSNINKYEHKETSQNYDLENKKEIKNKTIKKEKLKKLRKIMNINNDEMSKVTEVIISNERQHSSRAKLNDEVSKVTEVIISNERQHSSRAKLNLNPDNPITKPNQHLVVEVKKKPQSSKLPMIGKMPIFKKRIVVNNKKIQKIGSISLETFIEQNNEELEQNKASASLQELEENKASPTVSNNIIQELEENKATVSNIIIQELEENEATVSNIIIQELEENKSSFGNNIQNLEENKSSFGNIVQELEESKATVSNVTVQELDLKPPELLFESKEYMETIEENIIENTAQNAEEKVDETNKAKNEEVTLSDNIEGENNLVKLAKTDNTRLEYNKEESDSILSKKIEIREFTQEYLEKTWDDENCDPDMDVDTDDSEDDTHLYKLGKQNVLPENKNIISSKNSNKTRIKKNTSGKSSSLLCIPLPPKIDRQAKKEAPTNINIAPPIKPMIGPKIPSNYDLSYNKSLSERAASYAASFTQPVGPLNYYESLEYNSVYHKNNNHQYTQYVNHNPIPTTSVPLVMVDHHHHRNKNRNHHKEITHPPREDIFYSQVSEQDLLPPGTEADSLVDSQQSNTTYPYSLNMTTEEDKHFVSYNKNKLLDESLINTELEDTKKSVAHLPNKFVEKSVLIKDTQSENRLFDQWVKDTNKPFQDQLIEQSMQYINKLTQDQLIEQSMPDTNKQSQDQLIDQSMSDTNKQSQDQPIDQSMSDTNKLTQDQPIDQSMSDTNKQSQDQPIDQSISDTNKQSQDKLIDQSVEVRDVNSPNQPFYKSLPLTVMDESKTLELPTQQLYPDIPNKPMKDFNLTDLSQPSTSSFENDQNMLVEKVVSDKNRKVAISENTVLEEDTTIYPTSDLFLDAVKEEDNDSNKSKSSEIDFQMVTGNFEQQTKEECKIILPNILEQSVPNDVDDKPNIIETNDIACKPICNSNIINADLIQKSPLSKTPRKKKRNSSLIEEELPRRSSRRLATLFTTKDGGNI